MRDMTIVCRLIEAAVERLRGANDADVQIDALNEIARIAGDEALDMTVVKMCLADAIQPVGGPQ